MNTFSAKLVEKLNIFPPLPMIGQLLPGEPRQKRGIVLPLALVLGGLLGLAVPDSSADAAEKTAYSHDRQLQTANPDWMAGLSDQTPITAITFPGTHDSGATYTGGDIALTQSLSLADQLKSGIRAFDIRLDWQGKDRLQVVHGKSRQGLDFEKDVLAVAQNFLSAHPTETLIMRVRDENERGLKLGQVIQSILNKAPRVDHSNLNNLQLANFRGKIVVFQDYNADGYYHVPWQTVNRQDYFKLANNWGLAEKYRLVKEFFERTPQRSKQRFSANFMSASTGAFPYFVASGKSSPGTYAPQLLTGATRGVINTCDRHQWCLPQYESVSCFLGTCSVAFKGMNQLMVEEMDRAKPGSYGIIYADFPGGKLIDSTIALNFK